MTQQRKQIVTYEEQVALGLIRPATNFVRAEVVPQVKNVPATIVDPYAGSNASPVQYVVRHEVTPESRARAMTMKTHQVSVFLALLTGALMYVAQLYPLHWHTLPIVLLWLALASLEWLAAFFVLAVLDYRETPSAIEWKRTDGYLSLMKREQSARLMKLYGLTLDEIKRLDE
jgi:hypothetical protein